MHLKNYNIRYKYVIYADIDGFTNTADDILTYRVTIEQHDEAIADLLERLAQKGLILKLPKCIFDQATVEYYGCSFSNEGMRPTPSEINSLKEAKRPCDAKRVKNFLGPANYLKRFIDYYSTITYPLRLLTHKITHFKWDEKCEAAFQSFKICLSESLCISYYDEIKPIIMYCDASPVGVSSNLLQQSPEKEDPVVISYLSTSLTQTEVRYSEIERE